MHFDSDFNPAKTENLIGKALAAMILDPEKERLHQAIYLLRLAENAICVNPETSRRQFRIAARLCRPALENSLQSMTKGKAV